MSKIQALKSDALTESQSTPGITRHMAFKGDENMVLRSQTDPGKASGWHHHGDYDVYGYVVSGTARFENGSKGKETVSINSGDFFHVPPHTVHREINPSPNEMNDVILFLRGTGQMVVNVDSADKD
jgi:uncharacterized RmlC-like cupin family protein